MLIVGHYNTHFVHMSNIISEVSAKFAERLDLALRKANVSRTRLAQELNVAKSSITRWNHGTIPRAEVITQIAAITGVRKEWLSAGIGEMEPAAAQVKWQAPEKVGATAVPPAADKVPTLHREGPDKTEEMARRMAKRMGAEDLFEMLCEATEGAERADQIMFLAHELASRALEFEQMMENADRGM
jgi:transcriptional regulator with XRE-family HTH domain